MGNYFLAIYTNHSALVFVSQPPGNRYTEWYKASSSDLSQHAETKTTWDTQARIGNIFSYFISLTYAPTLKLK